MRAASSVVLAPVVLAAVWLGGVWLTALLAAALAVLAVEWRRLVRPPGGAAGLAAILAAALALAVAGEAAWALGALVPGSAAVAVLARRRGEAVWPAAFGPLYLGVPAAAIVWLRAAPENGAMLTVALFAAVWATDAGAWAVGRALGGARLAPRISPGKTWAGAAGGAASAAAAAAALEAAAGTGVGAAAAALAGLGLSAAAQGGDLFESWLKRRRGVKDSGRLIPGHGGLLDRVDGLLGAAPAAVALAALGGVR